MPVPSFNTTEQAVHKTKMHYVYVHLRYITKRAFHILRKAQKTVVQEQLTIHCTKAQRDIFEEE